MAPLLGYWDLRGLGQYIRFLLHHVGENYEEKVYKLENKPDGTVDRDVWLKDKFSLGLDFPNLPYYIDGNVKISQSVAILHYIGDKHGLIGSTLEEKAMVNMLEHEGLDLRMGFARLCYGENFETAKPAYIEGVKPKLEVMSKFLGEKEFLIGKITTADFIVYEALYCIRKLQASLIDDHSNLKAFLDRIENLPNIKKYMASSSYIGSPMNAPFASFGGNKE